MNLEDDNNNNNNNNNNKTDEWNIPLSSGACQPTVSFTSTCTQRWMFDKVIQQQLMNSNNNNNNNNNNNDNDNNDNDNNNNDNDNNNNNNEWNNPLSSRACQPTVGLASNCTQSWMIIKRV